MRPKNTKTLIVVAVFAVIGGACSGGGGPSAKAGRDEAPVTLRVGTAGAPSSAYADDVEHFADAVESSSDESIRVEVVHAAADNEDDLATMVSAGEIDLALVP